MRILLLYFITLISPWLLSSQTDEIPEPYYIKSVQFQGGTNQAQLPIIRLGGRLALSFDDLRADEADFITELPTIILIGLRVIYPKENILMALTM